MFFGNKDYLLDLIGFLEYNKRNLKFNVKGGKRIDKIILKEPVIYKAYSEAKGVFGDSDRLV